jgi:hypothetical protein
MHIILVDERPAIQTAHLCVGVECETIAPPRNILTVVTPVLTVSLNARAAPMQMHVIDFEEFLISSR